MSPLICKDCGQILESCLCYDASRKQIMNPPTPAPSAPEPRKVIEGASSGDIKLCASTGHDDVSFQHGTPGYNPSALREAIEKVVRENSNRAGEISSPPDELATDIATALSPLVEELQRDKERLGKMENHAVIVNECRASSMPMLFKHFPDGYGFSDGKTLRQRIDETLT